jgi:hypothetical protein
MNSLRQQWPARLELTRLERTHRELSMSYAIGGLALDKVYSYPDVDFIELESRFGTEFMQRLYFHIAALEAIPLVSFQPTAISFGRFARFATKRFEALWRTVLVHCGGEWRFVNRLPGFRGPRFADPLARANHQRITMPAHEIESLSFNGGGKDSLVAAHLLAGGDIQFATYAYSIPEYGAADEQHRLIDRLVKRTASLRHHRLEISDNFAEAGVPKLLADRGMREPICAETPTSIFGVLPIALQHGYRQLIVAHERSADEANLRWPGTGEEINHQWGKSFAAERLVNGYLQSELIANVSYFSILKPVYDVLIFNLLRQDPQSVACTHSCNIRKPWCGHCAKCAYVWLNFMAYLPLQIFREMFPENLFDDPRTQPVFRQLMGIEAHKPFECVGEVDEARLAFELCRAKGLTGAAMDTYGNNVPAPDVPRLSDRYLAVAAEYGAIPPAVAERIIPQMTTAAEEAKRYITGLASHRS